jgi:sugar lactone lactonase YvrE
MDAATVPATRPAPELTPSLEWLNVSQPVQLSRLRGCVCALVFFNSGSTWSLQRLADLAQMQARHAGRFQVVAIHVPRFDHERDTRRVLQRLSGFDLGFPVAQDADWIAWQQYLVEAWPTVVLLDANGDEAERIVGGGSRRALETRITELLEDVEPGMGKAAIALRTTIEPSMPLRFPAGIAVDGKYLYVADGGHHRVVECDLSGRILREFGTGRRGLQDGPADTAAFDRPHGLSLQRGSLYVADAGNHAVRRIDLRAGEVTTILGSGHPGRTREGAVVDPSAVSLDHPRALALAGDALLIACTGDNRVWLYDLGTHRMQLAAGSGQLTVHDGSGEDAAFAEPVALAAVQQLAYVCDAAGSAIRSLNTRSGQVTTLVGRDPWNHGQSDGVRSDALLQEPLAIALDPDAPVLWIADSGNNLLRTLRLGGGTLDTYVLPQPLHGPGALAVAGGIVWIADTGAHAILRLETRSGALHHIPIGE